MNLFELGNTDDTAVWFKVNDFQKWHPTKDKHIKTVYLAGMK